ncbi:2-keto-4-pentenoate hydratase [Altericroceibacterium xinjiangense]|uniref:2-keto-4-pentenoate hydratase n=1 Tax=Altericroceibacterium xinjiangense TaxID=762261 RepID=UPI001F49F4F9|nr:2-keto-4-pentenoate hydratase [Altericroceibacterium xinjiangense]
MVAANRDVAEAFVEARRSGEILRTYPGERPADLEAAYRIQDRALSLWARPIGGWKVGKINPPEDSRLGSNRLAGPIFADTIVDGTGEAATMPIFRGGFAAAEAEFMLRLAPPASDHEIPRTNESVRQWIDEIRIGIEIASSPYPGINTDGPCVTVSDHGNNAGLVLGPRVDRQLWAELESIEVKLEVNGEVAGEATTATMLDGPFGAVRYLLSNLQQRGITPQAGWWVSSGAITGVHEVLPGAYIRALFEGVGVIEAHIAP